MFLYFFSLSVCLCTIVSFSLYLPLCPTCIPERERRKSEREGRKMRDGDTGTQGQGDKGSYCTWEDVKISGDMIQLAAP